jgi:hypothetical protein
MDKLSKILKGSLARRGLLKPSEGAEICFYAEKWGKLPFCPISFSKGVLKVSVDSSAVSSELHMQADDLLGFINKKLGKKMVRQLRIINSK